MWEYVQISLDMATAVSVALAAWFFVKRLKVEKQAERDEAKRKLAQDLADEKRKLAQELVDTIGDFKIQIMEEVFRLNRPIFAETGGPDGINENLNVLESKVYTSLEGAIYYAHLELPLRAHEIARHYNDPKLEKEVLDSTSSFIESALEVYGRLKDGNQASQDAMKARQYYLQFLLPDIGFPLINLDLEPPGLDVLPMGEDLDEEGKRFLDRGYMPRRYIGKGDQPPTVIGVFDEFAKSLAGNR